MDFWEKIMQTSYFNTLLVFRWHSLGVDVPSKQLPSKILPFANFIVSMKTLLIYQTFKVTNKLITHSELA